MAELEFPRHRAQRVLSMLAPACALAGRHTRARLARLASVGRRSLAATAVGAVALPVVMPIPVGGVLPALALMLIGLGRVFRDGFAVILGLLPSGAALAATNALLLVAGAEGGGWIQGWV